MRETCQEIVRHIPVDDLGEERPDHAYLSRCGRPVERDGLCPAHLSKLKPRRRWPTIVGRVLGWN